MRKRSLKRRRGLISIQDGWGRIEKRPLGINPREPSILFFY